METKYKFYKSIKINKNLTIDFYLYGKNYNTDTGFKKEYSYLILYRKQSIYYSLGIKNKFGFKVNLLK